MKIRELLSRLLRRTKSSDSQEPSDRESGHLAGALAEAIVNEYGGVLEQAAKLQGGAPESLLPRKKETIEAAIVQYTKSLHAAKLLDAETYAQLRIGYSELAHFVPDSEARLAAIALGALSSQDDERILENISKAMDTYRKIMDEKLRRRLEFDEIAAEEEIEPVADDIK